MDNQIRQRLIGALILLALATIFWPIIFVGPDSDVSPLDVQVPDKPPVDLRPLPEPDDLGLRPARKARSSELVEAGVNMEAETEVRAEGTRDENVDAAILAAPPALPARADSVKLQSLDEAREVLQKPKLDADGLPIAFSLQVATMSRQEGAELLRDELVEAGYKGYLDRVRSGDQTLFRVMVGPKFRREELSEVKTVIDQAWSVDSIIVRYLP
ncbi:MAG: SPOR domain-containing protein [Pseudomonadota bacterium]